MMEECLHDHITVDWNYISASDGVLLYYHGMCLDCGCAMQVHRGHIEGEERWTQEEPDGSTYQRVR